MSLCWPSLSRVADVPVPFTVNGETSELEVTARLDRDEVELYRLVLVCSVLTDKTFTKFETSLEVSVFDEDDNAPFLNGTDSVEVAIEYNRDKVE